MKEIDEAYVIKQYGNNHSTYSLAKELGTYPKKIERILKKNGLICFTINEGIFKEYKFDIKINDLTVQNDWEIIKFLKTSYIIKKEVESWICLARKK